MDANTSTKTTPPPRLIGAIRSGFDTVANHIGLILFPFCLDLFLWLGPHYQLKSLFQAIMDETSLLLSQESAQMADLVKSSTEIWTYLADHFNLAISLRSYPIGIPSLMASRSPLETPFGNPMIIQIQETRTALLWWMVFSIVGMILGAIYFNSVSSIVKGLKGIQVFKNSAWTTLQTFILALCFIIILMVINLPAFMLLSVLSLISATVAQIASVIYSIVLAWIIVPLLFSPHGIYLFRQNAVASMMTSLRLVKYVLPGTGLFFLVVILLSQGLDLLWETPASASWMTLVGISGHAFISTALVAASFYYYRDAILWVQEFLQKPVLPGPKPSSN